MESTFHSCAGQLVTLAELSHLADPTRKSLADLSKVSYDLNIGRSTCPKVRKQNALKDQRIEIVGDQNRLIVTLLPTEVARFHLHGLTWQCGQSALIGGLAA